jgi:hypothetical protein
MSTAACDREHFPCDPSPLGEPSLERRAFLSPSVFLDGPFRLPLLLPEGGQGSRGPYNPVEYHISNERRQSSNDRVTGPHRVPPETGSMSPPCNQDGSMMVPPSDQACADAALPPQRHTSYVPVSSLPVERKVVGPGLVPTVRGPFFPVDQSPEQYFVLRDYRGPSYPPVPMRCVHSLGGFPSHLPPRSVYPPAVATFLK